ncbi:MAG: hypothetical protein ABJH68_14040 [Ilumatobacter sp.]|uniref:alpha/beta hydrolase family protein n=1 Tax=Ilumatobacter sp. TaxID=1967498 RepID=UPI0032994FEF
MRRLTVLFVGSLLVVACGGSSDGDATTAPESSPATEPAVTTGATDPEPTDPPATEPADTEPASTQAPATDPPATDPPASDPPATDPPATDLAAFAPIGTGEYDVGVATITITDPARERPLTTDVWFPLAADSQGDPHRYTFVTGDYYESPRAISATPDLISPDGPFPLVVYSHGSGGQRYIASDYTETIASHGYIVVAPDHTGNTAIERVSGVEIDRSRVALDRPLDVIAVIDAMLNPESTETVGFVGSVDPEQVAVTGHSFGGFTTYAVVSGYENELGSSPADDRIDAIIPLAPAVGDGTSEQSLLSDEALSTVDVPQLVMVGTDDVTTPVVPNVTRAFDLTTSDPLYRVELVAGEHQSFTDVCDYLDFFPTLDPPPSEAVIAAIDAVAGEGCSPDDMPIERVKELTNTFAVSFLDSIFAGGEMVTPDDTEIPEDVIFDSKVS